MNPEESNTNDIIWRSKTITCNVADEKDLGGCSKNLYQESRTKIHKPPKYLLVFLERN